MGLRGLYPVLHGAGRGGMLGPQRGTDMKKTVLFLAMILAFSLSPLAARAQQNPVTEAVRAAVSRHAEIIVAAAEEMPADKYTYAPTPQQMTFGHMVLHVAQSDGFLCSRISGEKAPVLGNLTENSPKSQLVAAMKSSFDYCEQVLAKTDDSNLSAPVQMFGGRMTSKAGAMITLSNDLADHYSQAAMYLRLNGHLPPTAKKGVMGHPMKMPMKMKGMGGM